MNRIDRISLDITSRHARNLIEAADYAASDEWPLNRFLTVRLDNAHVRSRPQNFLTHFLDLYGEWLFNRGIPRCWIWVFENSSAGGLHAHILLHAPPEHVQKLRAKEHDWFVTAGGQPKRGALVVKPIGGSYSASSNEPDRYRAALQGLVKYILKGVDEAAAREFGIEREPQGTIRGKRCGTSEALGKNARAGREWRPQIFVETLARRTRRPPKLGPRPSPTAGRPPRPQRPRWLRSRHGPWP